MKRERRGLPFGRYIADFAYTYVTYYAGLASVTIVPVCVSLLKRSDFYLRRRTQRRHRARPKRRDIALIITSEPTGPAESGRPDDRLCDEAIQHFTLQPCNHESGLLNAAGSRSAVPPIGDHRADIRAGPGWGQTQTLEPQHERNKKRSLRGGFSEIALGVLTGQL
jgi:hypothetical protein